MRLHRSGKLALGASLLLSFMSYGEDAPLPQARASRCEQLAPRLHRALQGALPAEMPWGVTASLHLPDCSWQGSAGPLQAELASTSVSLPEQHATLVVWAPRDAPTLPGVAARKLLEVLTPP
jgi:hypothetical protein